MCTYQCSMRLTCFTDWLMTHMWKRFNVNHVQERIGSEVCGRKVWGRIFVFWMNPDLWSFSMILVVRAEVVYTIECFPIIMHVRALATLMLCGPWLPQENIRWESFWIVNYLLCVPITFFFYYKTFPFFSVFFNNAKCTRVAKFQNDFDKSLILKTEKSLSRQCESFNFSVKYFPNICYYLVKKYILKRKMMGSNLQCELVLSIVVLCDCLLYEHDCTVLLFFVSHKHEDRSKSY